jgi:hypothetical protein
MSDVTLRALLLQILLWGALPLWILAGFVDWLRHRHSRIEATSGAPEAALHVLEYALTALPVLLGMYFEIDALVLVVMGACAVVHLALGWIDTGYTQPRRTIGAVEQAAHPFLELLPLFAFAVVMALYGDVWADLSRPHAWSLSLRAVPLPRGVTLGVTLALVPGLVLAVEELVRCLKARGRAVPGAS